MAIGIPPLLNKIANVGNVVTLLTSDFKLIFGSTPQWGIYFNGKPLIVADSVAEFGFKNESKLSDYPVEKGGFQQYNKVATPYSARVRLTKGGSASAKQSFLDAIETVSKSIDLYSVVTPEKTYLNANIENYDYNRTAINGASLLNVELVLTEVRSTATSTFSNTKNPSGASPVNGGTVTATEAPPQFANGGT